MLNINNIIEFENVHGKLGEDGFTYFLIDDVARELGFDRIKEYKNRVLNLPPTFGGQNKEEDLGPTCGSQQYYTTNDIRWDRINKYLAQYNLPPV